MTDTCTACRYHFISPDGGLCRRGPPLPILAQWTSRIINGQMQQLPVTVAIFPPVRPEMWCGEFRRAASGPVAVVATDERQEAGQGVVVLRPEPIGPHAGGGRED